jgi:ubiquinone/menaquinone biosynthesis C-methylase UbiE
MKRITTVLQYLQPHSGERILDVGCGVGTFAFHAAKAGAITTGIDYSSESINAARTLTERFGLKDSTAFVVGSALALPFADASFDKIVSADFIEHITHDEKRQLLKELFRVLKPGGRIVIFTPNGIREAIGTFYWTVRSRLFGDKVPFNELHYGLITRTGFEELLRCHAAGFKLHYIDTMRPFLAQIPFFKRFLSLDLLWVVEDRPEGPL